MIIERNEMKVTDLVIDDYLDSGYEIVNYYYNKNEVRIWVITKAQTS